MTIESAKEKIKALLERRGLVEQSMKEGLFTIDTGASKVGVELFGERPVVGVFINNKLEEEGHGLEAVFSLRSQVLAIWDREINRGASEQPAPKPEPKKAPPKCPICGKDMILTVIDVVDGGRGVGGVPIEGFVCEDEAKHKVAQPKPAEVVKPKGDEKVKEEKEKGLVPQEKIGAETAIVRPLTQNQIIEAAASTSKLLVDVIEKAKLYSMIQQKKYVRVEGWETLGALLLCSSEIVKSEEYKNGYRAEAIIKNQDGKIISNGIGICLRSEKNWSSRDDFAICSMAQTRAIGKAYRLGFAWIMSLAGYEVCPAEEMDEVKS